MKTTFVTSYLSIYEDDKDPIPNEKRIEYFKLLASTQIPLCVYISPKYYSIMDLIIKEYPNIRLIGVVTLDDFKIYN